MRTERIEESCPGCGSPYLWRVTGSAGSVVLECGSCPWARRLKAEGVSSQPAR